MWLMTSALTGYEKNRLNGAERVLRAVTGLSLLAPQMTIALPAMGIGAALIVAHRFLGGAPAPVDTRPT